jgi:hypothetical protein
MRAASERRCCETTPWSRASWTLVRYSCRPFTHQMFPGLASTLDGSSSRSSSSSDDDDDGNKNNKNNKTHGHVHGPACVTRPRFSRSALFDPVVAFTTSICYYYYIVLWSSNNVSNNALRSLGIHDNCADEYQALVCETPSDSTNTKEKKVCIDGTSGCILSWRKTTTTALLQTRLPLVGAQLRLVQAALYPQGPFSSCGKADSVKHTIVLRHYRAGLDHANLCSGAGVLERRSTAVPASQPASQPAPFAPYLVLYMQPPLCPPCRARPRRQPR